jgi:OOP family OmpA-OmpF porin
MFMKNCIWILLLLMVQRGTAQNKLFVQRADQAFAQKDYVTAAYYYDKALGDETATPVGKVPYFSLKKRKTKDGVADVTYRMAESYRFEQHYVLAAKWYGQVVEHHEASYPLSRLWYAVCLRANNELTAAVNQLQLFVNTSKGKGEYGRLGVTELETTRFAQAQMAQKQPVSVIRMPGSLKKEENDFALSRNNGQFWFTATSAGANHQYLNRIYVIGADTLAKRTALPFKMEGKEGFNFGAASLDATGNRMYLTCWSRIAGKLISGVYLSRYVNARWQEPQRLNSYVNADGFIAMQPFVTPDGKYLYFVSDRKGGFGGTDVWKAELNAEGLPFNAVNLGATVNSPADEQAPFYDQKEQRLVYSSKGFAGMGNFDLYESFCVGEDHWSVPQNLGYPYNSTKDDLHYYPDPEEEGTAYVSSDRESDCCLNLFKMHYTKPERVIASALLTGIVTDCDTRALLADVTIELKDLTAKKTANMLSSDLGTYQFKILLNHAYQLRLEKPGYFAKVMSLPALALFKTDTLQNPEICLQPFVVDKPIVIENVLYDFNKAILKPESFAVLDELVAVLVNNPEIRIELSAHTDAMGPDWYNMKLSQQRAQSCVDYILAKGIDPGRIMAKGYGETRPIQPNTLVDGKDNREGRRLNRRTEFKVLK